MSTDELDLVVVGNLIVDDLVFADGTTRMGQPGGAVIYVALAAQLCGLRVGIASRVGDDYPRDLLDALQARGIALDGVTPMDGPGARLWLLDEGDRRQVVHRLDGPTHEEACPLPDDLPAPWRRARAVHLAPMPFAVHQAWVDGLAGGPMLSLDPFELLRDGETEGWQKLLKPVDVFLFSEDEMSAQDPATYVAELARHTTVVYKQGARGGEIHCEGAGSRWFCHSANVVDTTGAGDAFAAGFLAGRLRGDSLSESARLGAAVASLAVEGRGPEGLLQASPEDLTRRLHS